MKENDNYIDDLMERRRFFHKNFPIKIGRQRADTNSIDILKNSCPVCVYLTLDERDAFDICGIWFWEEDGIDDYEEDEESGPNHLTLKEGRMVFQEAKARLMATNYEDDRYFASIKHNFIKLDSIIASGIVNKSEIIRLQDRILNLLTVKNIYGLEKLFDL